MAVTLTEAQVWSEFTQVIPTVVSAPLLPVIVGPQADLHRYDVPAEKTGINLGAYIPGSDNNYAWPDQAADSVIDLTYFDLFIDAALLNYYNKVIGVGGYTVTPVNGYSNRIIRSGSYGWASNGGSFPRDPVLGDRDVQVGDVVKVSDNSSHVLYTSVNALIADVVAASIASATSDAGNATTQTLSTSAAFSSGTANDVTLISGNVNGSAYNGLPTGNITETYTVVVTQGSSGGDATTALLQVTSASGLDNVNNVVPAAFSSPTTIGTRGLTAQWTHTTNDFVVGQTWTLTVNQAFTAPTPTSGGTFTGTASSTYIVKVSLGGKYSDSVKPQITVTNTVGTDMSGPTTVTAASTNVAVGTQGVLIQFSGTALRKGDTYYIVATAPGTGAYRTIQLNNNLSSSLMVASDLNIQLSIQENIPVGQLNVGDPPNSNWDVDQSQITVYGGITETDPSLTSSGSQVYVPVISGPSTIMYAQYREWLPGLVNTVGTLTVAAGSDPTPVVTGALGILDPDNPLAFGVYIALLNANGQPVSYTSVSDPTQLSDWNAAIAILVGLNIYSIVPLTTTPAVQAAFATHVETESDGNINGAWRRCWLTSDAIESAVVLSAANTTDHNTALATLTDNPGITGTQYTYVQAGSNVQFQTRGVQAGDVFRYLYTVDNFGNPTYTAFTVASVVNQQTLILNAPGNSVPVNVAQKFEIWRNYSLNQVANNIVTAAEGFANRGVLYVWPDLVEVTETTQEVEGYFLACAFAGFTAGICPHQGLKGIPITGIASVNRSTNYFSNAQLNILSAGGVFVVTQDGSGNVYCQSPLTTDLSSTQNMLEVVQRNDDTIQHVLYNSVAQFFGVSNVTNSGISLIESELQSAAQTMANFTFVNRLGDMITDFKITSLRASVTNPDIVVLQASVERPFPVDDLMVNLNFTITPTTSTD